MGSKEKKFNKLIIGLVIGSAVVGGLSMTPKGKSFRSRTKQRCRGYMRFRCRGLKEMKKEVNKQ